MDALHHGIRGNYLVIARRRPVHRPVITGPYHHQLRTVDEIMHNAPDKSELPCFSYGHPIHHSSSRVTPFSFSSFSVFS